MIEVGIAELKAHLSELLQAVRKGRSLIIFDRKTPIARVLPHEPAAGSLVMRKPIGNLHDVKVPAPRNRLLDSLSVLLADRQLEE
jgi:prevent-host-death family protein